MKFFHSIRWRLQLWHGVLLVIVLTGFGFTAYRLYRANQFRHIDHELEMRLRTLGGALRQHGRPPPGHPPPPGWFPGEGPPRRELQLPPRDQRLFEPTGTNDFYYVIWFRDGSVLSKSLASATNILRPAKTGVDAHSIRMRGTIRELYHYTPPGECMLVGRDIARDLAESRTLAVWLVVAGSVVLGVGLIGGGWLSAQAIRPVRDISATAAKIASGDLARRIPVSESESELGQLTAVLNSTFARLEAAFALEKRFTSDAAHELRTPLSVILTQTQAALKRERSAPEYREALEACERAAQRMRRLAESLLQLARLDAHEQHLQRSSFDLSKTAADCVDLLRPLAAERDVSIRCDLPPIQYEGDSHALAQVVTNLVTNSIYYNKPKGEVCVAMARQNGAVTLTVADTGVGIPPEEMGHVFERFFRIDKARSSSNGGTGLGLAIAKAIVEAHGGAIDVSSEVDQGSRFTVRLPVADPHS
jgi:two-component system OmpR family sensor kinase